MKKANLKLVIFNIVLNKRNSFFQHIYLSNTLFLHMKKIERNEKTGY